MPVPINIAYCREWQSIWLEGHFEKAAFSVWMDRYICRYWVHCARCTLQDNQHWGTEKIQRLFRHVPQRRVSGGQAIQFDRKADK